ncbi:MAG: anion transporter [candidate division Zixibacteria bacterium RBG_16_43_9]|nr:MAG: anion transporter [candidate division Zixibacteria bacterium RBG_16_43_9]
MIVEEKITSAEEKFEFWRGRVGIFLGPALFILVLLLPFPALSSSAHRLLAVLALVITFWITEAIPIPASALLGALLCVVLGIGKDKEVLAHFADPIVFLFIGSFILAEGMKIHRLDKRISYKILSSSWIKDKTSRLLLAIGFISAVISMWISNTATAAMVFPIVLGILRSLEDLETTGSEKVFSKYNTGAMLTVAYAASIGGIATPVGTPPNLIGIGMIQNLIGYKITFFKWMLFALPITLVSFLALYFLIRRLHPTKRKTLPDLSQYIIERKRSLGPWSPGEKNTLIAFLVAVSLWVLPGFLAIFIGSESKEMNFFSTHLPEGIVALIAASLLFILPVDFKKRKFTLTWKEAVRIDWGTILLFGGGLTLGSLMFSTGLAEAIGNDLMSVFGTSSQWGITAIAIGLGIIMSETTSNTASANMVIPIMIAISKSSGVSPLPPALGACLGASFGFMLPVSTPPNAIVYSSGMVPITRMIRAGVFFDILGFLIILLSLRVLCPILGLM